ncbi:hypothetical protein ACFLXW_00435 [Candidatus Dependentiae bacterium]
MKFSHFSLFSLLIILTPTFSCFGMKKEKGDPGCCGAVKKTAQFARERAAGLMHSDGGKDVELALLPASEKTDSQSPERCISSRSKKRLAFITALLALSVAGGVGYEEWSGGDKKESVTSLRILLAQAETGAIADSRVENGRVVNTQVFESGHPETTDDPCSQLYYDGDFQQAYRRWRKKETLSEWRKSCTIVNEPPGEFNMSSSYLKGKPLFIVGDDSGPGRTCQVQCYLSWDTYVLTPKCRSKEAKDRYYPLEGEEAVVNSTFLNQTACRFNEQGSSSQHGRRQNKQFNATRPTRERRPKQAKHRGR